MSHRFDGVALSALFLACSCSHLEVRTEVFVQDYVRVQERATVIARSLEEILSSDKYGWTIDPFDFVDERAFRKQLAMAWEELRTEDLAKPIFAGTPDDFAGNVLETVRLTSKTEVERLHVQNLLRLAKQLASEPPYYSDPNLVLRKYRQLEHDYFEIVDEINAPYDSVLAATRQDFGGAIRDYYSPEASPGSGDLIEDAGTPPAGSEGEEAPEEAAAELADGDEPAAGAPTASPAEETMAAAGTTPPARPGDGDEPAAPAPTPLPADDAVAAVDTALPAQPAPQRPSPLAVEEAAARADAILEHLLGAAFPKVELVRKSVESSLDQLSVIPMSDPDIPRIVGAPDHYWEGLYNHVVGRTYFGNAEVAIRMENLGEFHMKGVLFDPSKVTKATLDGVETAVAIAAAASGIPLPTVPAEPGQDPAPSAEAPLSRAGLQARINELHRDEGERRAEQAEAFYSLLGRLQALSSTNVANTAEESVKDLRTLASALKQDKTGTGSK